MKTIYESLGYIFCEIAFSIFESKFYEKDSLLDKIGFWFYSKGCWFYGKWDDNLTNRGK